MLISKKTSGFTIVELLIVVVVIGILAAIAIVAYTGITEQATSSSLQTGVSQASKKVQTHAIQNGEVFPESLSAVGLQNSASTKYRYTANNVDSPKTFCITTTSKNISYYQNNSTNQIPTKGKCPGHEDDSVIVSNFIKNPSLKAGSDGWTSHGNSPVTSTGARIAPVPGPIGGIDAIYRSTLTTTVPTGEDDEGYRWYVRNLADNTTSENQNFTPGGSYRYSMYVRSSVGGEFEARVMWAGSSNIGGIGSPFVPANTWRLLTGTITMPSNATRLSRIEISLYDLSSSTPVGTTLDVTGLMFYQGPGASVYADGNSPGWIWNGTPNNSTSTGPRI